MEKVTLRNDAVRYGTFLGIVAIVFAVAGMFWQSGWLSLLSVAVYVTLLYTFTKRHAARYDAAEGCSYGRCLKFILFMARFEGILAGAYQIVAVNWLFEARYEEIMAQTLAAVEATGIYTRDRMQLVGEMATRMTHSPIWVIASGIFGSLIKGLFFGLFVSAFASRKPEVFSRNNE